MTPGISFSTDMSVLQYVDSVGTKSDISILNGKAAKITVSSGSVVAAEVNSVPSNGTNFKISLSDTVVLIGYRPSSNQCVIFGDTDIISGISVRRHPIDMGNGTELYLTVNSSNELVVTKV